MNKIIPAIVKPEFLHSELTSKTIKCAMEVHKNFGNGFQEIVYQRCLAIELSNMGLDFVREKEMDLIYKNKNVGTRRVDFLVEGKIMVELKAITKLEDVHLAQTINYLEAYGLDVGLLISFGERSLNFKRVMNKKLNRTPLKS